MERVLVLGGGFGGLAAAHRLRQRLAPEDEVVVVDARDTFFPGLAKLWDICGIRELERSSGSLRALEGRGIRFHHASIQSIDPAGLSIETTEGRLAASALVIALGATFDPAHLAMLEGQGHNLYDATAAPAVRSALADLGGGHLAVAILGVPYKCPPAPYEAALLIQESLGPTSGVNFTVFTPQPATLPVAGPDASRVLAEELDRRGVSVRTGWKTAAIRDHEIFSSEGEQVPYDLLLGVPRHVAPEVIRSAGLCGDSGWIEPDRRRLTTAFPHIYAVGDCTHIPITTGALPKAGVFAEAEGVVAADNIAADLGRGDLAELDGHGYCFLEFGAGRAAYVKGDFFAEPSPDVEISSPDEETFHAKERFVDERLRAWF